MRKLLGIVGCALLLSSVSLAADQYANLKFMVVRAKSRKPIAYAAVILHPVNDEGKQERNSGLQLKTDSEGRAEFRGAPYGKLRVQVIVPGYQTFGEDYDIDQPTKEISIEMKRPQKQYSIYDQPKKQN
jgi:hypothetical protein